MVWITKYWMPARFVQATGRESLHHMFREQPLYCPTLDPKSSHRAVVTLEANDEGVRPALAFGDRVDVSHGTSVWSTLWRRLVRC